MAESALPHVTFAPADQALPDWRRAQLPAHPDTDELLNTTPPDVVRLLGFDPRTLAD